MSVNPAIGLCHWGAFYGTVAAGRLTAARPFRPETGAAEMIAAWPESVYSPLRIDRPYVRAGYLKHRGASDRAGRGREAFIPVDWETALDLVADELTRVRETHGPAAVFGGSYGWASAGRVHHARTLLRRFLAASGGFTDQIGNYSWGAAGAILPHVLGDDAAVRTTATTWPSIAKQTDLLVAFGGLNPKNWHVASGGAGGADMTACLRAAQARGAAIVNISPFAGDMLAEIAASWVPIRPNTDTALMLALAHVLLTEDRHDRAFLDRYCTGFDRFAAYLLGRDDNQPKTPAWAAAMTGIAEEQITDLARRLAAGRTLLTAAWSLQRADHGEQPFWALIALAAMLGQIGLPGGGFSFGYGSMQGVGAPRLPGLMPNLPGLPNPAASAIPVARIADMLLNPGVTFPFNGDSISYPDIRLVYWAGGNPFHHHQDLNRLSRAWERPETVIVHESWWTATARRADIVLPATTSVEREDLGGSSRDPFLFHMPQMIAPLAKARNDFDIFHDLAGRLGGAAAFTGGHSAESWVRRLFEATVRAAQSQGLSPPTFAAFVETGYWQIPPPTQPEILLEDFRNGAPLPTSSGKIELLSETLDAWDLSDCGGHPRWDPPTEWLGAATADRYPLHLLTPQPAHRLHSQLFQTRAGQTGMTEGRSPVLLHPAEAARRRIHEGALVRVFNLRGACLARAVLTPDVMPGVAILETGAWYDPVPDGPLSGLDILGNPNVLTRDAGTSTLAQATSAQSALVEIENFTEVAPAATVLSPPNIAGS